MASGWDTELDKVNVSFTAPALAQSISCLAGPVGSTTQCAQFEIRPTQYVRASQYGLRPGDRVDLSIDLPEGAVPANAHFEQPAGPRRPQDRVSLTEPVHPLAVRENRRPVAGQSPGS